MRWIAIALVAGTFSLAAQAQPGNGASSAAPNSVGLGVCSSLSGATPGLMGLCRAYCAPRSQSGVDMNDIASVRAAAPSIELLERYNALKTESDPEMPCFAGSSDDSPSDELPAPTSCACWTQEQLQTIDGILEPSRAGTPGAVCTLNDSDLGVYEAQIFDGYNVEAPQPTVVGSAFAYFDVDDPGTQGCMASFSDGSSSNFVLQHRDEAKYCIQTIIDQCATIGQ